MKNIKLSVQSTLLITGIAVSGVSLAGSVTIPHSFTSGGTAVAAEVNDNFSALSTAVNDNDNRITTNTNSIGTINNSITSINSIISGNSGNTVGDMQYWNGTSWVLVSAPAANSGGLKLTFCNGAPAWGCKYNVGDTGPAGGKVFYVYDNGQHGLEAAPSDQTASPWCNDTALDPTGKELYSSIGTGEHNTLNIATNYCTSGAANVAASYTLNGVGGWYLPSSAELSLLYAQKSLFNNLTATYYWSSTPTTSAQYSFVINFADGGQPSYFTGSTWNVRAIRSF